MQEEWAMGGRTSAVRVGVDVGGTKTLCVVVDESGTIIARVREPTLPWERSVSATVILAVNKTLDMAWSRFGRRERDDGPGEPKLVSVGIGIPGMVDHRTGKVHQAVNLGSGVGDIGDAVRDAFHVPVTVDNDVNAAAMGVYRYCCPGSRELVFLNLGTGVAAGIVLQGRLFRGMSGVAGEIGHVPLDPTGALCRCGQRGCAETMVSGHALSRIWPVSKGYPGEDLLLRARDGEVRAVEVWHGFGLNVARLIEMITATFDPADIFIGGGVSSIGDPLMRVIRHGISRLESESSFVRSLDMCDRIHLADQDIPVGALGAAFLSEEPVALRASHEIRPSYKQGE